MRKGSVPGGVKLFLVLGAAVLGWSRPTECANAATFTWTAASGTDLNWSDNANWSPAGPVGGGAIFFNTSTGTTGSTVTSTVDSSFNISSLSFASSGANFGTTDDQNLSIPNAGTTLSVTGAGGVLFGSTAFGITSSATGGSVSIAGAGAGRQ